MVGAKWDMMAVEMLFMVVVAFDSTIEASVAGTLCRNASSTSNGDEVFVVWSLGMGKMVVVVVSGSSTNIVVDIVAVVETAVALM